MSADHIAVAKRMYDARNRGDVEAVLAECDPDVRGVLRPRRQDRRIPPYLRSGQSSGIDIDVRVGHVLTFRNGKVLRSVTYLDRDEALTAANEDQ